MAPLGTALPPPPNPLILILQGEGQGPVMIPYPQPPHPPGRKGLAGNQTSGILPLFQKSLEGHFSATSKIWDTDLVAGLDSQDPGVLLQDWEAQKTVNVLHVLPPGRLPSKALPHNHEGTGDTNPVLDQVYPV